MTEPRRIRYRFALPDGTASTLDFEFDPVDFRMQPQPAGTAPAEPPFWTALEFCRCANCPLDAASSPQCPVALQMSAAIDPLKALASYDTVGVTVQEAERTVFAETTAQQAMSSVLGLIMATAGCPWTDHLRPMARFHLPFASEAETLYRSICMFLLARELNGAGQPPGFAALQELYRNLHVVNRDMSRRLGAVSRTDPARNAMALLDAAATLVPAALECSLEELKPLFDAWKIQEFSAI
jgi:hypothetical protein